jgi:23S rRNA (cytosine1962-C5)-methyltransferase
VTTSLPCLLFEDEHLLVVNKPAGWNTHAPSLYAGEGIYDWLRHREPRWANLAILHRLDKETSGVLVFGKTPLANQSLTQQFTRHAIQKTYQLLTHRPLPRPAMTAESCLVRVGEKYASRPLHAGAQTAKTIFQFLGKTGDRHWVEARPLTGRTHQIRVHAADLGIPILGDRLYGGAPHPRVCLHAASLRFTHPVSGEEVTFRVPVDFEQPSHVSLRHAFIDPATTTACRWIHGAADSWPGWYVDRLGDVLLSQSESPLDQAQQDWLACGLKGFGLDCAYHKILRRQVRGKSAAEASPILVLGEPAPPEFIVRENGVSYALRLAEGYSVGLFLDQRDNRRRLLTGHIAAGFPLFPAGASKGEVLNTFAYTCGFSVCAARAGARVTSLDLSSKYLEWGRRNFELNQLDPAAHDFIYGDVWDWSKRLARKGRRFEVVILDPPTFSTSKTSGVFQAEKDYARLVQAVAPLLHPNGVLLASTNAAQLAPEKFLRMIADGLSAVHRSIMQQHYVPQPPDFPVHRDEPAYLKTVWLRVA